MKDFPDHAAIQTQVVAKLTKKRGRPIKLDKIVREKHVYFFEYTDTFGGEANYTWVRRFLIHAVSLMAAMRKFRHETRADRMDKDYDAGEVTRYNERHACRCLFVEHADEHKIEYTKKVTHKELT